MNFGFWEILIILLILLVLFGAGKLPRLMGDFAQGMKAFKKGIKDDDEPAPAQPAPTATLLPRESDRTPEPGAAAPQGDQTARG